MRRLRVRAAAEEGMSLTEVLVTMMVMSVIVAATVTLMIGFQRTSAQNVSRQQQIDSARFAVEAMSKTVRAAIKPAQLASSCSTCTEDAFLVGRTTAVQFYANINNDSNGVGPSRVTYTLGTTGATAGQLIETVQRPDSNVPGATGYVYCNATAAGATADCRARLASRPLAFGVQASDTAPIFKYYDSAGTALTPPAGGTLTTAQLAKVVSIELVVTVQAPNATRAAPTTFVQRIVLPNAQAVIRMEEEATP